jgi:hypothetical protein
MSRKGIGVGSSSLVLVFTVLCLVIFTIISHVSAGNEMALAQSEADLVSGFYEADALAFQILNELVQADEIPDSVRGVNIYSSRDEALNARIAEFTCAITQQKELYVKIAFFEDGHDVLAWQLRNTGLWEHDTRLPLLFTEREED